MRLLALISISALLATPAQAGKNANGALIAHTNDANSYTVGVCFRFDTVDDPGGCESAGTQTNKPEDQPALIWLIAHFCPDANPGVVVIYFGLNHNLPPGQGYFDRWGFCGPPSSLEIPDAGWPETGGNSVAFGTPIVGDVFFPFYYVNAYGLVGAFLGTAINPTGGYAAFVDDSNPPVQDDVHAFGTVRWGTPGSNDCLSCPPPPLPEGCCFADCTCQDLLPDDCIAMGGAPMGPGTDCASFVCDCPPLGACCFPDGSCQWIFEFECESAGGMFYGIGSRCEEVECPPPAAACCVNGVCTAVPESECQAAGGVWFPDQPSCDPPFECPPVATEQSTWGRIKADYR